VFFQLSFEFLEFPTGHGVQQAEWWCKAFLKWNLVVVWPMRRKLPGDSFREQGQEFMVFLRDEGLEVSFLDPFVVQGLVDLVERQGEDLQCTVAFPLVAD